MDMVNDGKDIRLDTPQAVKEALASGKDLYNPETAAPTPLTARMSVSHKEGSS